MNRQLLNNIKLDQTHCPFTLSYLYTSFPLRAPPRDNKCQRRCKKGTPICFSQMKQSAAAFGLKSRLELVGLLGPTLLSLTSTARTLCSVTLAEATGHLGQWDLQIAGCLTFGDTQARIKERQLLGGKFQGSCWLSFLLVNRMPTSYVSRALVTPHLCRH